MKLNKKYQIEKAVSTDPGSFSLAYVHISEDKKFLVATTGKILAKVPVMCDETDDRGSAAIPPKVLEKARKLRKHGYSEIKLSGHFEHVDGSTDSRPSSEDAGYFPKYDMIIPKNAAIKHRVTFNPELLVALCKAIGVEKGNGVTLEFQDCPGEPAIIVRNGEGYGLLMPMHTKEVK